MQGDHHSHQFDDDSESLDVLQVPFSKATITEGARRTVIEHVLWLDEVGHHASCPTMLVYPVEGRRALS